MIWRKRLRPLLLGLWLALACAPSAAHAGPIVAAVAIFITTSLPFISVAVDAIIFYAIETAIYVGLSYGLSKLTGGRTSAAAAQERQASVLSLQVGEVARWVVMGEVALGGSLGAPPFTYGGEYKTDWTVKVIILADHRCDSLRGFYVNDAYVEYTADGPVAGYNGQLVVHWRDGRAGQTFPADLLSAWQNDALDTSKAPTSASIFTSMAYLVVAYKADPQDEENPVWSGGHPQMLPRIRGKRQYDPRFDDTAGGSGPQRWGDPSTWVWTNNAAVCRYNWVRGIYALDQVDMPEMLLVGRGLSTLEAPPARVFAYANLCDEMVDDGAGGEEPRYCVNGVIKANEPFIAVEQMFEAAMAGKIIQPDGGVEVEPGQAKTPVFEITDDDLVVGMPVEFNEFGSDSQRVNTVIGRYVEPLQKWADTAAPVQRDLMDIAADGGIRDETLPLSLVTSVGQAQRCARIRLRSARLERTAKVTVPPIFAEGEEGDWIVWRSRRHTKGEPVVFRIVSFGGDKGWRSTWTLEEIDYDAYGFGGSPLPASGGSDSATPPPGALTLSGVDAEAIQLAGEDGALTPVIRVTWDVPVDAAVQRIRAEVRRSGYSESAPTQIEAVNAGVADLTNGVVARAVLEVRLVPFGAQGRPIVPSDWIQVTTGSLVASGVTHIGGRTPEQVLADLAGVAEQGRLLTQAALETSLRLIEERGQLLSETFHRGNRVKRILIDEDVAWEDGDKTFWYRQNGIAILGEDGLSMVLQKDSLVWDEGEGSTLASHLESVISQIGSDLATAIEETRTWVDEESAGAEYIQSLNAAFGGDFLGSITTMASVVSGIGATWTLVLDVNGHVSGIRAVNDGDTSSIVILADEFAVTDGTTEIYPFAVVGGEVWATLLRAGGVFADTITATEIVSDSIVKTWDTPLPSTVNYISVVGAEVSVLSDTRTFSGGLVKIEIYLNCNGNVSGGTSMGVIHRVYRDGSVVHTFGHYMLAGKAFNSGSTAFTDRPGSGSHTYEVKTQRDNSSGFYDVDAGLLSITDNKTQS
ncbi:MAG: phage tail protein [Phenylobacterium sp.]|uniref:phage tail protein n=1 Tax=Phenylobacterium sp. TaxID=1871053 RepID=UPI003BB7DB05